MSDRDKDGLRGPVSSVVTEETFPDNQQRSQVTITREYAPDGRLVEMRNRDAGREWVRTYTYDKKGHLVKISSGDKDAPGYVETYSYDDAGRLLAATFGDKRQVRYQYDDKGRKSAVETYDSKPPEANAAYVPHWEGSQLGFGEYSGGSLTTSYNEQGVATGAQLRDAQGRLVGHITRKFDAEGRIVSEDEVTDAPELLVPEQLGSDLSPEQRKAMGAFIAGGFHSRAISYIYDAQGRLIETRSTGGVFGTEVEKITYNDRGDKASEIATSYSDPDLRRTYGITDAGALIPVGQAPAAERPGFTRRGGRISTTRMGIGRSRAAWCAPGRMHRLNPGPYGGGG